MVIILKITIVANENTKKDNFEIAHCFQNREKHDDVIFKNKGVQRIVVSKHDILMLMQLSISSTSFFMRQSVQGIAHDPSTLLRTMNVILQPF